MKFKYKERVLVNNDFYDREEGFILEVKDTGLPHPHKDNTLLQLKIQLLDGNVIEVPDYICYPIKGLF